MNKPFIIGVGNSARSDDGVGAYVADCLAQCGFQTLALDVDGTKLFELFTQHEHVLVVDAINSDQVKLGECLEFDALHNDLPVKYFHYSSHLIGVAEGINLAKTLGSLPKILQVFGISGKNFAYGFSLTPQVKEAADNLIERIKLSCMK